MRSRSNGTDLYTVVKTKLDEGVMEHHCLSAARHAGHKTCATLCNTHCRPLANLQRNRCCIFSRTRQSSGRHIHVGMSDCRDSGSLGPLRLLLGNINVLCNAGVGLPFRVGRGIGGVTLRSFDYCFDLKQEQGFKASMGAVNVLC